MWWCVVAAASDSLRSRLAQLVERKTLNLVVEGSSPSVGSLAPVAQLAARRSHNPKVASSILAGSTKNFADISFHN